MAENNNEKDTLYWINRISAFATSLIVVVSIFVPDEKNAKKITYIIALVLAFISFVAWLYKRKRDKKKAVAGGDAKNDDPTSLIRGLLAFVEGDVLYGRDTEIRDIYTRIRSGNFKFGVLWGESGSGKTSIIGAGVVPHLKKENYIPVFLDKPSAAPHKRIEAEIAKICDVPATEWDTNPDRVIALLRHKSADKHIFFIDQFEEYFLLNPQKEEIEVFKQWIAQHFQKLGINIIVAIRTDFFARLQYLAPEIEDPTSNRRTYELENFKVKQATGILRSANKTEGMQLTEELITEIVSDLNNNGFIRPPELQLVADYLKKKGIDQLNKYIAEGRASGILSAYIKQEIERTQNKEVSSIILRLMCAEDFISKSPADISIAKILAEVHSLEKSAQPIDNIVKDTLKKFEAARIIVRKDDDDYNLAHDYLAPLIRNATQGFETKSEWATRTLRMKTSAYLADNNTRLGPGSIIKLQRYASKDLLQQKATRELIHKSKIRIAISTSLIILPFLAAFLFLSNSYYMGVTRDKFGSITVVLKAGHSSFKILPNNTIEETWFSPDDLTDDEGFRTDVNAEAINRFRNDAKDSLKNWIWPILNHLSTEEEYKYYRFFNLNDSFFKANGSEFIYYPPSLHIADAYIDSMVNNIKLSLDEDNFNQLLNICFFDTSKIKYINDSLIIKMIKNSGIISNIGDILLKVAYIKPSFFNNDKNIILSISYLRGERRPLLRGESRQLLRTYDWKTFELLNYLITTNQVSNAIINKCYTTYDTYIGGYFWNNWFKEGKKYLNDQVLNHYASLTAEDTTSLNKLGPELMDLLKYDKNIQRDNIEKIKALSIKYSGRSVKKKVSLILSVATGPSIDYDSLSNMLISKDLDNPWKRAIYALQINMKHFNNAAITPYKMYAILEVARYLNPQMTQKLIVNTLLQGNSIDNSIMDTLFRMKNNMLDNYFPYLSTYNPSWLLRNDSLVIAKSRDINNSLLVIGKCRYLCDTSEKNKDALLKDLFCLTNRRKRHEAIGGLFQYCLQKPRNIPALKKTLDVYKKSIEPTHRISASMLWEMIDLIQRVNEKKSKEGLKRALMYIDLVCTDFHQNHSEWHLKYAKNELSEKLREGTIDF